MDVQFIQHIVCYIGLASFPHRLLLFASHAVLVPSLSAPNFTPCSQCMAGADDSPQSAAKVSISATPCLY